MTMSQPRDSGLSMMGVAKVESQTCRIPCFLAMIDIACGQNWWLSTRFLKSGVKSQASPHLEVCEREGGVCRSLAEEELRVWLDGCLDYCRVSEINKTIFDAKVGEHHARCTVCPACNMMQEVSNCPATSCMD
jgi:hypothetical protein